MCIYTEHIWNMISPHIDLKSKMSPLGGPMGVGLATGWVVAWVGPKKNQLLVRVHPFRRWTMSTWTKRSPRNARELGYCKTYGSYDASQCCGGFFLRCWQENTKTMGIASWTVVEFVVVVQPFFSKNICVWRWYCQADMAIHVVITKPCFDGILFPPFPSWTENH